MKYIQKHIFYLVAINFLVFTAKSFSQVESPTLSFNRGALWQSVYNGKVGPIFSNWGNKGVGLDWPGFDKTWINTNIGGTASHLATGGFWIGAKKSKDSVISVEDWSIYAGTISSDAGAKYRMTQHHQKFKNGENYWLKENAKESEEEIESSWEYNKNYSNTDDRDHQLPVRVTRRAYNWSGSKRDENYIIYEYTIKNISNEIKAADTSISVADTLYDLYLMANYAMHVNSRAWTILFPSLTPGARNTWYFWDNARKMIYGRSGDYLETVANEEYGFVANQGQELSSGSVTGEWTAPGFVGVRLLYSSPDNTGQATRVNQYGWSAGLNSIDQSGPFNGIPGTADAEYAVLKNIATAASFVSSSADTIYMRRNRMWSLMSLGPWTILPGDSIVVALAEVVNGIDYADALNKNIQKSEIGGTSSSYISGTTRYRGGYLFNSSADKAKFTYDQYRDSKTGQLTGNGLNHPDPPAAPTFTVSYYKGTKNIAANVLRWGKETESIPDPDDGTLDLAGYNVYRSNYLPIGPWTKIATIIKGDPNVYSSSESKYVFVDTSASIGTSYYYSLTAYDTGKASWPINPSAVFPETGSNRVPPLESSIFANRMTQTFTTTFPPATTLSNVMVVPNPFVLGNKYASIGVPGSDDDIQFVNIPNPCTIRIYTVRGDLVKTITVASGAGAIATWDQSSDYGQFVGSGIYIYHIDSPLGTKKGKLAIVR
jgi:hypothetical protein